MWSIFINVNLQNAMTRGCNTVVIAGCSKDFSMMLPKDRVLCEEIATLVYNLLNINKSYGVNCYIIGGNLDCYNMCRCVLLT